MAERQRVGGRGPPVFAPVPGRGKGLMLRYSREEVDEKDYSDFSTLSPDDSPTYSSPAVSSWEDRGDDKGEDDDESEVIGKFPLVEDKAKSSEPLTLSSSPTVSPPEDRRVVIGLVAEYQHYDIESEETMKFPLVGDKEPLSTLIDEYKSGSVIFLEKIKILAEHYVSLRRTRRDGNCFFRCFVFSYLEHILESQDKAEVDRIKGHIQASIKTLKDLHYDGVLFSDFYGTFTELLDGVIQGHEKSLSDELLLQMCQDELYSDAAVMFCRCVTSGEIQSRRDFFEPFLAPFMGASQTLEQFCRTSVEVMKQESDHAHIVALTDALGVPVRVVYLDSNFSGTGPMAANQHDFLPSGSSAPGEKPFINLLYRPGHYDILYPK